MVQVQAVQAQAVSSDKPSFLSNAAGAIYKAYKAVAGEVSVLTFAVINIMRGTQGVGAFSTTSPGVKMAISVAGLVKSTFESIAAIPKFYDITTLRSDLFEHVKAPNKSDSRERRIESLTASCTHIRDNEKTIRKSLFIAKTAGLLTRANEALDGISASDANKQTEALEKGEEYVRNLRRRVNSKFGVALANLVSKVAGLAVSILLVAITPTALLLTVAGVVGVATLTVWASDKIMHPADPFKDPKDVWYETIPHKIRTTAYKISDGLKDFFAPKQVVPQPVLA